MSKPVAARKKSILVIDGQPTIRDVLDRFLRAGGYLVMIAADFEEGLGKARLLPVSLVVLDVDLLRSKASEARAKLKSEPATAYVPVILISSQLPKRDLQKIADGRDGILTMPFSLTDVLEMVNRMIGR
jgi:CheY-like chemotaxis protein